MKTSLASTTSNRHSQRGFSGVLAVIALVIMASLTSFGVNLMTSMHSTYAQEVSLAQATLAAEAGLDWARYRIKINNNCAALQNLALPGTLGLYRVTVRCTRVAPAPAISFPEGGTVPQYYSVTADACIAPAAGANCPAPAPFGPDYVIKTLTTWVER
ncbi:MAG: hypothetical protein V4532_08915 [Pseudomonadota bacterium]